MFVSGTKLDLRYMRVTSLTPLQEEFVESFVGEPKVYVHKETGVLTEDQDAARYTMDYVLRRIGHRVYINSTCKAETGAGKTLAYGVPLVERL